MDAETCREILLETISASVKHFCSENGIGSIWREPLVGFADACSPMFPELRTIAYRDHLMPSDILSDAETVISYFLPFERDVGRSNEDGTEPSEAWVRAYEVTNRMAVGINQSIVDTVNGMGFSAKVPENIGQIGTYSIWSQRHVARIAGLGSFGLNNMLISESGCCGRYFSVVTNLDIQPDAPFKGERCLFRRTGKCGICVQRCVGSVLEKDGFDRDGCNRICSGNEERMGQSVCGKCVVGLPCSYRAP